MTNRIYHYGKNSRDAIISSIAKSIVALAFLSSMASPLLSADQSAKKSGGISKEKPEVVYVYSIHNTKAGEEYELKSETILYPERKCHLKEIINYQKMGVASMYSSPMCYGVIGDTVYLFSPFGRPTELLKNMFANGEVVGENVRITRGIDHQSALDEYKNSIQESIKRTSPGAPLPPREIAH